MLDENVFRRRMETVHQFINEKNIDFAIITPSPTFLYLTGLSVEMRERVMALVIPRNGNPSILSPAFEISHLASRTWVDDFIPWEEDEDPYRALADHLGFDEKSESSIMLDNTLPLGIYWSLKRSLGQFKKVSSITPLIESMRLRKSPEEVSLMKRAGEIIAKVFDIAFKEAHVGISELELMQVIQREIVKLGATPTFAAVQFGENSALPHISSGKRALKQGDLVLFDCGCSLGGYNTDMTRVGVVGDPSEDQLEVYEIVLRAQETAIEAIAPGLTCGRADGIARLVIEKAGYAEQFTHRLGHGIGIEVHEPPYLVRGNPMELGSGMTHSIEPGIYLEGLFGVRIEDLVCVTDDGCELITFMDKDLVRIEL